MIPVSDGGEGMLKAFCSVLDGKITQCKVHDPLMRAITAEYGITTEGTAIIETAEACGLNLMKPSERNPMAATTYGVGELICDAMKHGCRNFIIGLGGSGTSDCGIGMLNAIYDNLKEQSAREQEHNLTQNKEVCQHDGKYDSENAIFSNFPDIHQIINNSILHECKFIIASDVRNPLYGKDGAAYIFSPQKGASPETVKLLDKRAMQFAGYSAALLGKDTSGNPGAGAAGGLGYAFMQYLDASITSGADLLLDISDFGNAIKDADLIITGEGHADKQTLMGKLPERILRRAKQYNIPVWLIAGRASDKEILISAGFNKVDSITPDGMNVDEAVKVDNTIRNIRNWVEKERL